MAEMRLRADRLMGHTRLHTPTVAEPLLVVLVDEIAALTGWISDRTMKKRIDTALSLLLTQGRAVGGVVVGAIGARETLWLAGGLSALAGVVGLAVLAWRRGGAREVEVSAGTIGSP